MALWVRFLFLIERGTPRSNKGRSLAASDWYKRQATIHLQLSLYSSHSHLLSPPIRSLSISLSRSPPQTCIRNSEVYALLSLLPLLWPAGIAVTSLNGVDPSLCSCKVLDCTRQACLSRSAHLLTGVLVALYQEWLLQTLSPTGHH